MWRLASLFFIVLVFILGIFARQSIIFYFYHPSPVNPSDLKDNFDTNAISAIFNNKKISINFDNNTLITDSKVLGEENNSLPKRIEVDLKRQRLYAYEGDLLRFNFLISSGKWNSTPDGTFKIWAKVRSQKMSGGSKQLGTYYYLPNVPYIMFFYNETTKKSLGYSFHGTYWHNNFGTPMSHGCINMNTSEAKQLFNWAEIDTPVVIYNRTSNHKS
jgi:hypothetical protein